MLDGSLDLTNSENNIDSSRSSSVEAPHESSPLSQKQLQFIRYLKENIVANTKAKPGDKAFLESFNAGKKPLGFFNPQGDFILVVYVDIKSTSESAIADELNLDEKVIRERFLIYRPNQQGTKKSNQPCYMAYFVRAKSDGLKSEYVSWPATLQVSPTTLVNERQRMSAEKMLPQMMVVGCQKNGAGFTSFPQFSVIPLTGADPATALILLMLKCYRFKPLFDSVIEKVVEVDAHVSSITADITAATDDEKNFLDDLKRSLPFALSSQPINFNNPVAPPEWLHCNLDLFADEFVSRFLPAEQANNKRLETIMRRMIAYFMANDWVPEYETYEDEWLATGIACTKLGETKAGYLSMAKDWADKDGICELSTFELMQTIALHAKQIKSDVNSTDNTGHKSCGNFKFEPWGEMNKNEVVFLKNMLKKMIADVADSKMLADLVKKKGKSFLNKMKAQEPYKSLIETIPAAFASSATQVIHAGSALYQYIESVWQLLKSMKLAYPEFNEKLDSFLSGKDDEEIETSFNAFWDEVRSKLQGCIFYDGSNDFQKQIFYFYSNELIFLPLTADQVATRKLLKIERPKSGDKKKIDWRDLTKGCEDVDEVLSDTSSASSPDSGNSPLLMRGTLFDTTSKSRTPPRTKKKPKSPAHSHQRRHSTGSTPTLRF